MQRPEEATPSIPAIVTVNRSLSFSYVHSRFNYIEPDNGQLGTGYLDYERGNLKGAKIDYSYMGKNGVYLRVNWTGTEGQVVYTGHMSNGIEYSPLTAKSRATIQDYDVRIGRGFPLSDRWMLTPYLTGGRRYWVREIGLGTAADYVESYSFFYYGFGALVQYAPAQRWVLTGDAAIGKMEDPWINTPAMDHAALGPSPVIKLGLELDYRATSRLHAFTGIDYTYFTFGQSAIQSSGYLEPFSRTETYRLNLGLRLAFGRAFSV